MGSVSLLVKQPDLEPSATNSPPLIALAGNPNAGKTTLFNLLTGLRAKTANFPGTTIEHHLGKMKLAQQTIRILDLPGLYGLSSTKYEEQIALDALKGNIGQFDQPTAIILIIDATNLERNLYLASQILQLGVPTIVALNMIDLADRQGLVINDETLTQELGCPVVKISARSGRGVKQLHGLLEQLIDRTTSQPVPPSLASACECKGCPHAARYNWAEQVGKQCVGGPLVTPGSRTEKIDQFLTHPVLGIMAFLSVMAVVFMLIFVIAQYPMDWIDSWFAMAQSVTKRVLPAGDVQSLVKDGIIGGVGGMLVFLPQICVLFFFIAILEDTGYLARGAFVMDRLMCRVGLPGKAFVPMLTAHACAIPGIMATRVIEDPRDRLLTIIVLPLVTCSARLPVYAMVTALLFPHSPIKAGLLFTGAYFLGVAAALIMAMLFKRTILPGQARPLVLELPGYKVPSLRTAFLIMVDRARIFVKQAGGIILIISVVLWAAATYPKSIPPAAAAALQQQAAELTLTGDTEEAKKLITTANRLTSRHALEHSIAGRFGKLIEPVIRPLGFDWQIGVGVISSFAAREVIVSTLSIVYGLGEQDGNEDSIARLYNSMRRASHTGGDPVFTLPACFSLLVFYILAMQCLPTQVVTRRETNSWKWPLFQLGYMTLLAYGASLVTYQTLSVLMR